LLAHAKEVLLKAAASSLPSYSVLLKITLLKYLVRASKICMLIIPVQISKQD